MVTDIFVSLFAALSSKSKRKNLLAVAKLIQSQASQAVEESNQVRAFATALLALPVDAKPFTGAQTPSVMKEVEGPAHELVAHCRRSQQAVSAALKEVQSPVANMLHLLMERDTALVAGSDADLAEGSVHGSIPTNHSGGISGSPSGVLRRVTASTSDSQLRMSSMNSHPSSPKHDGSHSSISTSPSGELTPTTSH